MLKYGGVSTSKRPGRDPRLGPGVSHAPWRGFAIKSTESPDEHAVGCQRRELGAKASVCVAKFCRMEEGRQWREVSGGRGSQGGNEYVRKGWTYNQLAAAEGP